MFHNRDEYCLVYQEQPNYLHGYEPIFKDFISREEFDDFVFSLRRNGFEFELGVEGCIDKGHLIEIVINDFKIIGDYSFRQIGELAQLLNKNEEKEYH